MTLSKPKLDIPSDWDEWLTAQGGAAGFCQTSTWARIHAAVNRASSFALSVIEGGERRAGMLISLRPPGPVRFLSKPWLRNAIAGRYGGALECFEGPVLPRSNPESLLSNLLRQVDILASTLGIRSIRFSGLPPMSGLADANSVADVFRSFNYRQVPWQTAVVDLSATEVELLGTFRQAARKGIRKCIESGLSVTQCVTHEEYVRDFREPYYAALAAEGKSIPLEFHDLAQWEIDGGRHYRFLVAKDGAGQIHATLGTYTFNGVATEIMSGRTLVGKVHNLPAQDLLHWEAFKIHRAAGDRWFNLAGYNPVPRNEKEGGIRRFKQKWNGLEISAPQFFRSIDPPYVRAVSKIIRRWQ
jgi:hypothetical protein